MAKAPAFQFYPGDWVQDTRHLSLAAKGAWIDLLGFMWRAQIRGRLTNTMLGYARLIGATVDQAKAAIDELTDSTNQDVEPVCNRTDHDDGRVTLENRRMYREARASLLHSQRQDRYRQRNESPGGDGSRDGPRYGGVTRLSSSSSSNTTPKPPRPAGGNGEASENPRDEEASAAADAASELERLGVSSKKIDEIISINPSLSAVSVLLAAAGLKKSKTVKDPVAVLATKLTEGFVEPALISPLQVCELERPILRFVGVLIGKSTEPQDVDVPEGANLKWNNRGVVWLEQGAERGVRADQLRPAAIIIARGK